MPMQFPCGIMVSGKQNVPDDVLIRLNVKVRKLIFERNFDEKTSLWSEF